MKLSRTWEMRRPAALIPLMVPNKVNAGWMACVIPAESRVRMSVALDWCHHSLAAKFVLRTHMFGPKSMVAWQMVALRVRSAQRLRGVARSEKIVHAPNALLGPLGVHVQSFAIPKGSCACIMRASTRALQLL